jgi:hypothetical protein
MMMMADEASSPSRASFTLFERFGDSESQEDYLVERATLLLLIQPPSAWPESRLWPSTEAHALWTALMDLAGHTIVAAEVGCLNIDCNMSAWFLGSYHGVQSSKCSPCRLY